MKKILMLILAFTVITKADIIYGMGGNGMTATFDSENNPVYVSVFGIDTEKGLRITLEDLSTDGRGIRFEMQSHGIGLFNYTPGDTIFNIPSSLITTSPYHFQITDLVGGYNGIPARAPQQFKITLTQFEDVVEIPVSLDIQTRDHFLGRNDMYVLSMNITNTGTETLEGFKLRYFITEEHTDKVMKLVDYYTPKSDVKLLKDPTVPSLLVLELDYSTTTLIPGATTLEAVENQIHLYYPDYSLNNKANDFSNPVAEEDFIYPASTLFRSNSKVAVYSADGSELIWGEEDPTAAGLNLQPIGQ